MFTICFSINLSDRFSNQPVRGNFSPTNWHYFEYWVTNAMPHLLYISHYVFSGWATQERNPYHLRRGQCSVVVRHSKQQSVDNRGAGQRSTNTRRDRESSTTIRVHQNTSSAWQKVSRMYVFGNVANMLKYNFCHWTIGHVWQVGYNCTST